MRRCRAQVAEAEQNGAEQARDIERRTRIGASPVRILIKAKYPDAEWNGKIYGNDRRGHRIRFVYLDGVKIRLSDSVISSYDLWRTIRDKINAEYGYTTN
ncbi:MAG: hypothetical protein LBQ52_05445 [Helicobacteraceae bacterium]|jgi:hypothetical protein|nr:hypothetical protein [Helicobacteraceae bacterium]